MGQIKLSLQLYFKLIPALVLTCFAGLLHSPVYAAQLQIPGFTVERRQFPILSFLFPRSMLLPASLIFPALTAI